MSFEDLMKRNEMNKYFLDIWEFENPIGHKHTKSNWNTWARKWEDTFKNDKTFQERTMQRVYSSIDMLKKNNALNKNFDVIDIGCGPFRFVCELAKYVRTSTGLDHSEIMVENGLNYAKSLNLKNVYGIVSNFKEMNIDEYTNKYDLVFSFVTPAIGTLESLKKINRMSKKFCFNGCFTETVNSIRDDVQMNVFKKGIPPTYHGNWYYCLWNMLWLSGFSPITDYFCEEYDVEENIDDEFIKYITHGILLSNNVDKYDYEKTADYLFKKYPSGKAINKKKNTYGYILWDVSKKLDMCTETLL